MSDQDMIVRVDSVFRRVFKNDGISVQRETTAKYIAGWDSITHLDIISGIEEEFNVEITGFEVMNMSNVGDLYDLLTQKLAV
jgi:acyl carrier protein